MDIVKQLLKYFLSIVVCYALLVLLEVIFFEKIIYLLADYAYLKTYLYLICFVLINPLICYYWNNVKQHKRKVLAKKKQTASLNNGIIKQDD